MAGVQNADGEARASYPRRAFDGIPKSTFALLAYHLALRMSAIEDVEDHGAAIRILAEEAAVLHGARMLTDSQARACARLLIHKPNECEVV